MEKIKAMVVRLHSDLRLKGGILHLKDFVILITYDKDVHFVVLEVVKVRLEAELKKMAVEDPEMSKFTVETGQFENYDLKYVLIS